LAHRFASHPHVVNGIRGAAAFAVLMLPTTALGATLPVLVAALCRPDSRFGYVLGRLYGWNTLGAVAGVLAAETLLVPRLGVAGAAWVAAVLDLCAAGVVWLIAKQTEGGVPSSAGPDRPRATVTVPERTRATGAATFGYLLTFAFVSGLALMALEVIWFRFLSMFAL